MRSFAEIAFRLRQETANIRMLCFPPAPRLVSPPHRLSGLPDPEAVARALAGSPYADKVRELARTLSDGKYPLFDTTVALGREPAWRRDWQSGQESGLDYFRRIPYLDPTKVGDHKRVWEPARHQHLVLLAQAALLEEDPAVRTGYLALIESQLLGFIESNPFQRGMHWASALEVSFRALSWIWIDHLAGSSLTPAVRERLRLELYRHGLHLAYNLSIYFSRNTHLLGEAVALHALGVLYPEWPAASGWRQTGEQILAQEIDYQVLADGADFEQSSYYHVYALDMFLFHWLLAGKPVKLAGRLAAMAEYLDAWSGSGGPMPLAGDDDGGRFFHPYGPRERFYQATVTTAHLALQNNALPHYPDSAAEQAAWWLGVAAISGRGGGAPAPASRRFPEAGLVAMAHGDARVWVDAGGFGSRRGGHSHSDSLQILVRRGERELLVDAGTYTYVSDRKRRDWFRSTAAHNTVRVDGAEQGDMDYPFGWRSRPDVQIEQWEAGEQTDCLTAVCRYRNVQHRRTVHFHKREGRIEITDEIDAGPGEHLAEQFWHMGEGAEDCVVFPAGTEVERGKGGAWGWRSRCLGQIEEASYAVARVRGVGILRLRASIVVEG
ncbi:MAG TPA: alginate lyase family protein [Bryobacteraceae bacterium]|nr:alginate lyase family protein [Bryobacteraceae bacterium]